MVLLDLESELARARDGRAFSNGFEGESWTRVWCADCQIGEEHCPLIGVALLGRTPAAWEERQPMDLNRYVCHEYREIVYEEDK